MVTCAFVVAPYNLLKRFSKKRPSKKKWSRKKKRLRARCRPALPYLGWQLPASIRVLLI